MEDHIRLHMMNPDHAVDSPEELGEDLIGLVRAYLKQWLSEVTKNARQKINQDSSEPPEAVLETLPVRRACTEQRVPRTCFRTVARL